MDLNKELDDLITNILGDVEVLQKSEAAANVNKKALTADEALSDVPTAENDDKTAGRPKEISDVPAVDEDGKRSGEYDSSIAAPNSDTSKPEDSQVKVPEHMKKSVSLEEWAEFETWKAAQADLKKSEADAAVAATEELAKSNKEATEEVLVKGITAAVAQVVEPLQKSLQELTAKYQEQEQLIKSFGSIPQRPKSVTGIAQLEKSEDLSNKQESFSKSELLDAAESLCKSGAISMEEVIELENTGRIFNPQARQKIESFLSNNK